MPRKASARHPGDRPAVILLVVIAFLVLFSAVGLAFVVYAEAQATTARVWREGETREWPDMDPEMLLAYFLGQFIYGSNNPLSAFNSPSPTRTLADNLYGAPGGTVPYDASKGAITYTYPDLQNMYLAAVKAGPLEFFNPATGQRTGFLGTDGAVLIQSFVRQDQAGNSVTLRAAGLPPMEDRGGDVKNLHFSPGTYIPGTQPPQFANNDSIWMDLGFPVMRAPNGMKFKALFAPLIIDLDNKLNVNVHGNILSTPDGAGTSSLNPFRGRHVSHQGFGPWEVNLEPVFAPDVKDPNTNNMLSEARRVFIGDRNQWGSQTIQGRYVISTNGNWSSTWLTSNDRHTIAGPFYSPTDGDATYPRGGGMGFPGFVSGLLQVPSYSAFPYYADDYDGWVGNTGGCGNPSLYNFFNPGSSNYYTSSGTPTGRNFPVWELEALLRYGDTGSPSLPSRLFRCCPKSMAIAKTRRMLTTHAFDIDRPSLPVGLAQLAGNPTILSRLNLNRDLPRGSMGNVAQDGRNNGSRGTYPDLYKYNVTNPIAGGSVTLTTGKIDPFNAQQFINATKARQDMAQEIFDSFIALTGSPLPNTLPPGDPQLDNLRWLAQLAVNIVDYIDIDDYITPFAWHKPDPNTPSTWQWVYGTEQPRLVVNEVYAEVANDPNDPFTGSKATLPYRVRFWVELNNPLYSQTPGGKQSGWRQASESGRARLRVPLAPNSPWTLDYAPYRLDITTQDAKIRTPTNAKGDPDPTLIKTSVTKWQWDTTATPPMLVQWAMKYPPWQDEINVVQPMNRFPRGVPEDNFGYYLVGPPEDFPGTDTNKPKATLRVKDDLTNKEGLAYQVQLTQSPTTLPPHSFVLRRLACPAMKEDPNPASPTYNPYVTVDYVEGIKINDGVQYDSAGAHTSTPVQQRYSIGRSQPYAAHSTQQVPQKPTPALKDQPQHSIFGVNVQVVGPTDPTTGQPPGVELTTPANTPPPNGQLNGFANHWLNFADRPLISPVELLMVSQYRPHELTQQFAQGPNNPSTGEPSQTQKHLANWFDPARPIYRLFEVVSAGVRPQWTAIGGPTLGRININTVWDREIFRALVDPQLSNFFYDSSLGNIDKMFDKMVAYRSPGLAPGPNDKPFHGMGASLNIEDTILRTDPFDNRPLPPQDKRRVFEPEVLDPNVGLNRGHPYMKQEVLQKIYNNLTTRSNVFAVWLTVGFFQVIDDSAAPPTLGPEIGRAEGRHVRHRMFAIVDRSSLTVAGLVNAQNLQVQPVTGLAGPRPVIIPTLQPILYSGQQSVEVPNVSQSSFDGISWTIATGDYLLVEPGGRNQEVVQVLGASGNQITARFTKPHPTHSALVLVQKGTGLPTGGPGGLPGHPGPQPRFDMRNPIYQGVVRHFSIIE